MTTTETIKTLRNFNRWRRGDDGITQPSPTDIGNAIDAACDRIEELETNIYDFIEHNLHLADGDNCTLKPMVNLINFQLPNED